ncbi:MAG: hypothetical protein LBM93_12780 [Oscillospiraceae bacterium]|jgi:hypothetical protein|nr:hypothetical protein [Oscillospiraceae bacterium]
MGLLYEQYLKTLTSDDLGELEDKGQALKEMEVDDFTFKEWQDMGLSPIEMLYDYEGNLEGKQSFVFVEKDGDVTAFDLTEDGNKFVIDGNEIEFESYSQNGETYYKLPDGTIYRNANKEYY